MILSRAGFALHADDLSVNVAGNMPSLRSFPGSEYPGTSVTLGDGPYTVHADRDRTLNGRTHITGYQFQEVSDCSGTIHAGDHRTCELVIHDHMRSSVGAGDGVGATVGAAIGGPFAAVSALFGGLFGLVAGAIFGAGIQSDTCS